MACVGSACTELDDEDLDQFGRSVDIRGDTGDCSRSSSAGDVQRPTE